MPWGWHNISFGCFAWPQSVFPVSPSHMRKMSQYFCNWPSPHVASQGSYNEWTTGSTGVRWTSNQMIYGQWMLGVAFSQKRISDRMPLIAQQAPTVCACLCSCTGYLLRTKINNVEEIFAKGRPIICCSSQIQSTMWGLRHGFKLG